jgi:ABC-2 type transport system permease protein
MRKLWIVAWNDLRMRLLDKQSWLLLLVLPAVMIYLVGLGAQSLAQRVRTRIPVDVLDHDRSVASRAFIAALEETNPTILVCPADDDPTNACALEGAFLSDELAQEHLDNGTTFATLTIPEGFSVALERGDEVALVFESGAALAAPEIVFGAVQSVVAQMGGKTVAARLSTEMADSLGIETDAAFYAGRLADAEEAWGPSSPIQITTEFTERNRGHIVGHQLLENGYKLSTPGIAAMFVMISILGMAQSLAEERMTGVLQRVGMMPVTKAQLLGGKLLQTSFAGLLQFAILLGFGSLLGVDFGSDPLAVILVAGAYVLAITAMALALATLARASEQASAMATIAWMVLLPLGGAWWPLAFVPSWMQTLGHLSPVAWCVDALNALIFHQGTLPDVLEPVGVLLLFATVFLVFGVRQFSYHQAGALSALVPTSRFRQPVKEPDVAIDTK